MSFGWKMAWRRKSSAASAEEKVMWLRSRPGDIPGDGEVIEGIASVAEPAITGESALRSGSPGG